MHGRSVGVKAGQSGSFYSAITVLAKSLPAMADLRQSNPSSPPPLRILVVDDNQMAIVTLLLRLMNNEFKPQGWFGSHQTDRDISTDIVLWTSAAG